MVGDPLRKRARYQDVLDAPEHMVAEVLDGELHLRPRPRRRHTRSASALGAFLVTTFDIGINGGPGGWTILDEPEHHGIRAQPFGDVEIPPGVRLGSAAASASLRI